MFVYKFSECKMIKSCFSRCMFRCVPFNNVISLNLIRFKCIKTIDTGFRRQMVQVHPYKTWIDWCFGIKYVIFGLCVTQWFDCFSFNRYSILSDKMCFRVKRWLPQKFTRKRFIGIKSAHWPHAHWHASIASSSFTNINASLFFFLL